ncbi:NAD(P)/FAD-dependent oxidoreductase [Cryobacterium sinapicolor]|uniref:NAD(P)/FAD-dependent oxidoreductase n=1 Tax=Cryobacterium sinapicolor TaxID=1259236 RepID=UPI0018E0B2D5|nr:NAD(P)/FAD-dependent oxidoreductase [Cryobacterium sinapicolor]
MNEYDVLVVGGGAAGLTAAMVLLRARRLVAVVDAGAPRNAPAAAMRGFLSRDGMSPRDLVTVCRGEVAGCGGTLVDGTVASARPGFHARLADGTELWARRILVATGLRDEVPDIPGVRERWGRDLLHCRTATATRCATSPLECSAEAPKQSSTPSSSRQWSPDVILFTNGDAVNPDQRELLNTRGVSVITGSVARLVVADDRLFGVELADGVVMPRTAVFVRPRFVPNSDLLATLGCDTDASGWVTHDTAGRTSVAGVRAAGATSRSGMSHQWTSRCNTRHRPQRSNSPLNPCPLSGVKATHRVDPPAGHSLRRCSDRAPHVHSRHVAVPIVVYGIMPQWVEGARLPIGTRCASNRARRG